jgi:hypothetical protein
VHRLHSQAAFPFRTQMTDVSPIGAAIKADAHKPTGDDDE